MADITPSGFESQRQLAAKTGDGLDMVISTGYALLSMKGLSGAWNRQDLVFQVGPWWGAVRGTTVVVSPSSMFTLTSRTTQAGPSTGWVSPTSNRYLVPPASESSFAAA